MPTTVANLSMNIGEDKAFQDTIVQSDGVTPQDLTTWVAIQFVVHAVGDPNTVFITKGTVGPLTGVTILSPATNGVIQVTVNAADTTSMNPNEYEYRIERVDISADLVLTRGLFTLAGK